MKATRLERIYLIVLITIFAGVVLQGPISVGATVLAPSYAVFVKSWKEILMLLLVPLAIYSVSRRRLWPELSKDWIFRLIVAYTALHVVVSAVLYKGIAQVTAGLAIDLRYILFFGLVYALLRTCPQYRRPMLLSAAIGAVIVIGFGTLQVFLPADILSHIGYSNSTIAPYLTVDKNHDFIRINSTLRGPNPVGAYAVIVLAILASILLRARGYISTALRRWAIAVAAVAILVVLWVSYARSAWLAAVVAIVVVLATTIGRRLSRRNWIISVVVVLALAGGLIAIRGNSFVSNVILHENPNGGSAVSSNEGHAESLRTGTESLISQPFGTGIGSTGSASLQGDSPTIIENQYLFVAHETGWLGVGLFIALFSMVLLRLWRNRQDWVALGVFAGGIGLAVIGLLLPVFADDTIAIVWWGLAATVLAGAKAKGGL